MAKEIFYKVHCWQYLPKELQKTVERCRSENGFWKIVRECSRTHDIMITSVEHDGCIFRTLTLDVKAYRFQMREVQPVWEID